MIVINRFCRCRRNSSKGLVHYISTTVTSRCDKPKDGINKTEEKNDQVEKNTQKFSKKLFQLFEDNVSEEKRSKAAHKLKSIKMSDEPVTKTVEVTQKTSKEVKRRPVDEVAKKAKSRLEYNLVQSAKKVSDEFGGNVNETDTELLSRLSKVLNNFEVVRKTHKVNKPTEGFNKDEHDVKVDDGLRSKEAERLKGILRDINKVYKPKDRPIRELTNIILLSDLLENSGSLNIFHPDLERSEKTKLKIWDELERDHLKSLVKSSPRNYYQELIKWTEEGKLWHFPINNEQGMDEEANVDFTEHVFLEDHLEPWCPKTGPLRHFMELVCVGLSKNPYLKVEDKREHIYWFRDYFEEKKRILQELGALAGRKELEGKEHEAKQKSD